MWRIRLSNSSLQKRNIHVQRNVKNMFSFLIMCLFLHNSFAKVFNTLNFQCMKIIFIRYKINAPNFETGIY